MLVMLIVFSWRVWGNDIVAFWFRKCLVGALLLLFAFCFFWFGGRKLRSKMAKKGVGKNIPYKAYQTVPVALVKPYTQSQLKLENGAPAQALKCCASPECGECGALIKVAYPLRPVEAGMWKPYPTPTAPP